MVGWGSAGEDAHDLAGQVLAQLRERGQTVAVAESLTGGLVASRIVSVPGASTWFRGAVVSNATDVKHDLLDIPEPVGRPGGAVYRRQDGRPGR